ncbi:MAG: D-alanyl-D-alanine carboxypeptidase [Treponema sp.]|jgi:D-alanyl-D-alanine carboxypeptidase (penicillin-binding protein 5/6)|nr:D-alanyl-D-alanine carboxypeptidase [Treponema sp.]
MSKKIFLSFWLVFCLPFTVFAQYFYTPPLLVPCASNAPEIVSVSAVLIDAQTGALLYSKNPDEEISPASLTKLMTLHLLMKEIEEGRASYDEIIPITGKSWAQSQPPRSSLMFLAPGQTVTLREIMMGLAIPSGNDAAMAAALRFAPSMEDFAVLMTEEARRMGLAVTRFTEASGISEYNMTTAAEFAFFCRQYIKLHPQSLKDFHSVPVFSYPLADNVPPALRGNPQTITQYNRNSLLKTFPGVDGLKTGYIDEAGYNIALTAQRNSTRFIAVILGAPANPGGSRIRDEDSTRLLTWAFENFKTVRPVINMIENVRLWKGKANSAELQLSQSADFTSPVGRADNLWYEIIIPKPLTAPLTAGAHAGWLVFYDEHGELSRTPLVTARPYAKGNIFKRLWHSILLLFNKR